MSIIIIFVKRIIVFVVKIVVIATFTFIPFHIYDHFSQQLHVMGINTRASSDRKFVQPTTAIDTIDEHITEVQGLRECHVEFGVVELQVLEDEMGECRGKNGSLS